MKFERYQELPLWNGKMPFTDGKEAERTEHYLEPNGDGIQRLTDVTQPSITYFPVSGRGPHPAVVVCPGGGYGILAWNHEGIDLCSYFNSIGFTAFLLKYRVPGNRAGAHADACRAMRLIRANAEAFDVNPDKIGIMGFSAGGHLAATVAAPADPVPYEKMDEIDELRCTADFAALIYPAYLCDTDLNLAPEFKVDENTPPTFLIQTEDDEIHVECSLAWYLAMTKAKRPAEMHLFPEGGHGYGILRTGTPVANWPKIAAGWFERVAGKITKK